MNRPITELFVKKHCFSSQRPTGLACAPHCHDAVTPQSSSRCATKSQNGTSLCFQQVWTCWWNFPDPLATKAGDARQRRGFKQLLQQILPRFDALELTPTTRLSGC
ncbi:hypothetical protein BN2476_160039 [Paraburkholderia piptadeniae]|uniref:Uncharacterized protein n=1 Tax=Paraburkholderia piptadeniae TaxID=1701573 RepID=A0A1N7RSN5_9BURK|nr:hypothetical protein BN2476_160039 [Paraburkholderia piptadeniae]